MVWLEREKASAKSPKVFTSKGWSAPSERLILDWRVRGGGNEKGSPKGDGGVKEE